MSSRNHCVAVAIQSAPFVSKLAIDNIVSRHSCRFRHCSSLKNASFTDGMRRASATFEGGDIHETGRTFWQQGILEDRECAQQQTRLCADPGYPLAPCTISEQHQRALSSPGTAMGLAAINVNAVDNRRDSIGGTEFRAAGGTSDMYDLALLLTADPDAAKECCVAGLEDCANGNRVFREWAQRWARRVVIGNAIRMVLGGAEDKQDRPSSVVRPSPGDQTGQELRNQGCAAILSLDPMARFAYVLTDLEGYTEEEAAILLEVSLQTVQDARDRAGKRSISEKTERAREATFAHIV